MSGSGSGRPLSALKRVPPLDLPERYMQAVPDEPHSPWEAAAPPEGEPSDAHRLFFGVLGTRKVVMHAECLLNSASISTKRMKYKLSPGQS